MMCKQHSFCVTLFAMNHDFKLKMEVASSRRDHVPTLSAAKASKLFLFVKSPFRWRSTDVGNAAPTFCFCVSAILKLTRLTLESVWTAPTETAKHLILAIDKTSKQLQHLKFVDCSDKTESEIVQMITETFERHAIPLADCWTQGYSNAESGSGKYNGTQAIIKQ